LVSALSSHSNQATPNIPTPKSPETFTVPAPPAEGFAAGLVVDGLLVVVGRFAAGLCDPPPPVLAGALVVDELVELAAAEVLVK